MCYNKGIMPELPEVETVRRGLGKFILNKKIVQVRPEPGKGFYGEVKNVNGATVVGLRRKGKALIVDLSNGWSMMVHLRMTGQLIWRGSLSGRTSSLSSPVRGSRALSPAPLRASSSPRISSQLTSPPGDQEASTKLTSPQDDQRISSQLTSPQGNQETNAEVNSARGEGEDAAELTSVESDRNTGSGVNSVRDALALINADDEDAAHASFAAGHPSKNFTAELPNGQTRVIFEFEDGNLFFNDQRKFGFVKVLPTEEVELDKFIMELGKEPWEMTAEELFEKCQRHGRAPIKAVLLNQKLIAGLGNIYADESLFYAGVYPAEKAGDLSLEQVGKLLEGARTTMEAAIDSGGSTMATYVRPDGTTGNYLENFAQVFRRDGKKCRRCGEVILKMRCAGRGTHYCPKCQPAKMAVEGTEKA